MRLTALLIAVATPLFADVGALHIKSAMAAYQTGEAAAKVGHYGEAIDQFRRVIEIEPTYREAFDGLIAASLNSGRRSDAAAVMTRLLEIEPDLNRYRLLLGQILIEEDQPERALAQFSYVLKSDSLNADALLGFAAAAKRIGMDAGAADAMDKGRKQYPLDIRFQR